MEAWCEKANAKGRRHLGGSAPVTLFQSEKPYLLPLPVYVPEVYALHPRVVDLEGMVNLHNNRYSVPEDLIGRQVEVRRLTRRSRSCPVMRWPPLTTGWRTAQGAASILPEHRHKGRAHRKGIFPPPEEKILPGRGNWRRWPRRCGEKCGRAATRALRHLHRMYLDYPGDALKKAATMALAHGLFDTADRAMILRSIAGEFFQLPLPPEPGKDEDPGGHGEKKTGERRWRSMTIWTSCSKTSNSRRSGRSSPGTGARGEERRRLRRVPLTPPARGVPLPAGEIRRVPHPASELPERWTLETFPFNKQPGVKQESSRPSHDWTSSPRPRTSS